MKNIVVAIDFDQKEAALLRHAALLADKFNAKVWVVHCAAPDPEFVSIKAASQYERDARADQLRDEHKKLRELAEGLINDGVDAEALLIQGPTVETLLGKANDVGADLIISGLHDHSFFYNAMVGNTSLKLLRKTEIPVLTIPVDE